MTNFLTDGLLLSAFALRVAGLSTDNGADPDKAEALQLKSFQVLSCVAPLIWIKVVRASPWFPLCCFPLSPPAVETLISVS